MNDIISYQEMKDAYQLEESRRCELNNSLKFHVSLITAFTLYLIYIGSNISHNFIFFSLIQFLTISISSLLILYSVKKLIKCHFGHPYECLATPKEIMKYKEELLEYNYDKFKKDKTKAEEETKKEILKYKTKLYIDVIHQNTEINSGRYKHRNKFHCSLLITLGVLFFSSIILLLSKIPFATITNQINTL